jgi:hypothetical protein
VTRKPLISEQLAAFLESGLSIVIGTRNGDLEPAGATALAIRVAPGGARVTLFVYEQAGREMLANLGSYPEIAIDMDQPTSHRACQVKGLYESSRTVPESERELIERQLEGFAVDLEAYGVPRPLLASWKSWPCLALEVRVTHVFEQTPGPGTGELLE